MSKVRTTVTIDDAVLKAVKIRAARTNRRDSEVIEESLRRDLGLDLLERIWARADMDPADAEALALEAQDAARRAAR